MRKKNLSELAIGQCQAVTSSGWPCRHIVLVGDSGLCVQHHQQQEMQKPGLLDRVTLKLSGVLEKITKWPARSGNESPQEFSSAPVSTNTGSLAEVVRSSSASPPDCLDVVGMAAIKSSVDLPQNAASSSLSPICQDQLPKPAENELTKTSSSAVEETQDVTSKQSESTQRNTTAGLKAEVSETAKTEPLAVAGEEEEASRERAPASVSAPSRADPDQVMIHPATVPGLSYTAWYRQMLRREQQSLRRNPYDDLSPERSYTEPKTYPD